jgi:hypothetical protein
MRLLLPLLVALAALLLAAGFPRIRWLAAGVVVLVLIYMALKLGGIIDGAVPSRSGVY